MLREHPAPISSPRRAARAAAARRSATSTSSPRQTDPKALTEYLTKLPWVAEVAAQGPTKATVVSHDGLRFDLRVVPPESYGNLLQHFTGSKDHNVALREDAVRRGLSISEYGVQNVETKEVFQTRSEEELYAFLGYQFIPPELRENRGELAAAREGELPEARRGVGDLRGDLHYAHALVGRTQHGRGDGHRGAGARLRLSGHLRPLPPAARRRARGAGRGDRRGRRAREAAEAAQGRRGQHPPRRLAGHGRRALAGRDWVVASLHSSFDRSPTERLLAAMENPHVDCIGHPTGRKINKRPPADVNSSGSSSCARDRHRARDQLAARPARPQRRARAGRGRGRSAHAVNSDGHGVETLHYVEIGAAQARRAWMTTDQVLNTQPWSEDPPNGELSRGRHRRAGLGRALPGARGRPAGARTGRAGRADRPPARRAAGGAGAVCGRAARPGRGAPAGDHALEPPALLRLLRDQLVRAGHPRRVPRRRAEHGRDPLAASPASTELEYVAAGWLAQLLGLPAGWHGHIEDTASTSTLAALAAARTLRPDAGVVVCSEHAHSSVEKAARIVGLETRKTPADDEFRLRPEALDLTDACAVVATVGTTSSTSVDPVGAIADRAGGAWLHVDAAYAGAAMVCPEFRWAFDGVDRADSLVVNAHKWLLVPTDCSCIWTSRPDVFREAFSLVPSLLALRRRGGAEPLRLRSGARAAVPVAEAVGRPALLRPQWPAGGHPRARPARRALRGMGAGRARLGGVSRRGASRSCAFGGRAPTRRTAHCSIVSTDRARSSSRRRSWTGATSCVWRSATSSRPRLTWRDAWDVLRAS